MLLSPAQKEIAQCTKRFRVVNCGRRFGKTTLAILEMIGKAAARDGTRVAYIAPTYQQARDIAWEQLKKIAAPAIISTHESRLELRIQTQDGGQANIALRGWENVETLRGQRFDFLVIDEIAMMRNWALNWQEVLRPTLTDSRGEALFISTPKGFNHFYDLFKQELKDSDYQSFHFTSYDNPYIPKEEIDKAKEELTEDRFAQEYLADFRKTEGLVYKEFNRQIHVVKDLPARPFNEIIAGIDFGFTNPACILKIGKDYDGTYWVMSEWYERRKTNAEIIEKAQGLGLNIVYPDPAEPDRIEEMKRAGLNCREVNKDISAGIDRIRELFKQNRIKIHESCLNLIWELETYRYPEKKPNHNEKEDPVKENDHAVDALRYALFTNQPAVSQEQRLRVMKNRMRNKSLR